MFNQHLRVFFAVLYSLTARERNLKRLLDNALHLSDEFHIKSRTCLQAEVSQLALPIRVGGQTDSWHLSSVAKLDGRLMVSHSAEERTFHFPFNSFPEQTAERCLVP